MAPLGVSGFLVFALAAAPAPEIDKYLPNDADFVLFVNVRQTLDSPLAKKYLLDPARNAFDNDQFKPPLDFPGDAARPVQGHRQPHAGRLGITRAGQGPANPPR